MYITVVKRKQKNISDTFFSKRKYCENFILILEPRNHILILISNFEKCDTFPVKGIVDVSAVLNCKRYQPGVSFCQQY